MDSNHDKQNQNLRCYRYTIGQSGSSPVSLDNRTLITTRLSIMPARVAPHSPRVAPRSAWCGRWLLTFSRCHSATAPLFHFGHTQHRPHRHAVGADPLRRLRAMYQFFAKQSPHLQTATLRSARRHASTAATSPSEPAEPQSAPRREKHPSVRASKAPKAPSSRSGSSKHYCQPKRLNPLLARIEQTDAPARRSSPPPNHPPRTTLCHP